MNPRKLNDTTVVTHCKRLLRDESFGILQGLWLNVRTRIIEEVKKHKRDVDCAKLEGFDLAIMEVDRWANKKPKTEAPSLPEDD